MEIEWFQILKPRVRCQAVHRYQRLGALLRGEAPRALLQAVPRGYVAARARALAEGPCLAAFRWAAGGAWGGKPWSVELPTDSALLLYLFAAFLEARRGSTLPGQRHVEGPGVAACMAH